MSKLDLKARVLHARNRRNDRMRKNYHLCRGFNYTAEESTILMNQSWKNIIANAYMDGRHWISKKLIQEEYSMYAMEMFCKYKPSEDKAVDVGNAKPALPKPPQDLPRDKTKTEMYSKTKIAGKTETVIYEKERFSFKKYANGKQLRTEPKNNRPMKNGGVT